MLMMRAPAVRIMRSRPRAEAASSKLLALHRAAQKPAPTPHKTRAHIAAIHQLISSFRVRAGDPARARITSISGTLTTRRRRVGGFCPLPFKGFAFMASPSSGGHRRARCAARFNGCRQCRRPQKAARVPCERGLDFSLA